MRGWAQSPPPLLRALALLAALIHYTVRLLSSQTKIAKPQSDCSKHHARFTDLQGGSKYEGVDKHVGWWAKGPKASIALHHERHSIARPIPPAKLQHHTSDAIPLAHC